MALTELDEIDDERFALLYEFLRLSPTYRSMSLLMRSKSESYAHSVNGSSPMERVAQTYRIFGNVYEIPYDEWVEVVKIRTSETKKIETVKILGKFSKLLTEEETNTRFKKAASELPQAEDLKKDFMLVSIPLQGNHQTVQDELKLLITQHVEDNGKRASQSSFAFQKNKLRTNTLTTALNVIHTKIVNPDAPLFVIGNSAGVSPENVTENDTPRNDANRRQRQRMEIFTSRYISRGFILAQNAALGKFPSLDELPSPLNLKFDWVELHKLYSHNLMDKFKIQ